MLKDITIGQYYKEDSLIHRLDPRVKLFAVLIYVITLFMHKAPATYVMSLLFLDHNDQDFKGTCKIYFKRIKMQLQ